MATHPYYADGWDRDKGISIAWLFKSILKISTGEQVMCASTSVIIAVWIRSLNYMRKKKRGTPLFVFNVTMQNHGGYSDTYDNFTPDITVEGWKVHL